MQAAYRCMKAKRMLKRLIRRDWKKRVDPQSGELFYYNIKTGESKWTKPYLLGPADDLSEPPYYCVLQPRANGPVVYYNRATGVSSDEKPIGMQLCYQCQTFYATVRCVWNPLPDSTQYNKNVDCRGRPFCDDCFKSYHVLGREDHPHTSISVRPAVCKICNDPANYR